MVITGGATRRGIVEPPAPVGGGTLPPSGTLPGGAVRLGAAPYGVEGLKLIGAPCPPAGAYEFPGPNDCGWLKAPPCEGG
jgi:hypothetical protein